MGPHNTRGPVVYWPAGMLLCSGCNKIKLERRGEEEEGRQGEEVAETAKDFCTWVKIALKKVKRRWVMDESQH